MEAAVWSSDKEAGLATAGWIRPFISDIQYTADGHWSVLAPDHVEAPGMETLVLSQMAAANSPSPCL